MRRSSFPLFAFAYLAVMPAIVGMAAAQCPVPPPYDGPIFDANVQAWNPNVQGLIDNMAGTGVKHVALFANSRAGGPATVAAVLRARQDHPEMIVAGVPKIGFIFSDDLPADFVSGALSGIADGTYSFVGEILYTHADKGDHRPTRTGEVYVDPLAAGTARLLKGLAGRDVPLLTHWEAWAWDRDWPKFDQHMHRHLVIKGRRVRIWWIALRSIHPTICRCANADHRSLKPIMAKTITKELAPDSLDLSAIIRAGDTVMWGQASAEPLPLTQALMAQRRAIGRFNVFLGVTYSDTLKPEYADCVSFSAYCGTGGNRALAKAGKLDILPVHYSQLPALIQSGKLKVDVLMLQLAPADAAGNYSLSMAHEYLIPALAAARVVIAEVNEQAPWTFGERPVREDDLDYIVRTSRPPLELHHPQPGEAELAIARHVAGLVEDGATLQFGLGALPEAILAALADRRDLGIHSGAIGDTAADLMESGVITNARKSIDRGVTVAGVIFGSKRIQQFCHRNPAVQFRSNAYTHNAEVLARIERFVALNTAVEVDLSGQINAETAGGIYVGAVGGALDFLRGAQRSKGGLPIVALPSTAGKASRIVAKLSGPVSTPRSDAGIIVTEYGVADLRGAPLSERARRMIAIAHPDLREQWEH